MNIIQLPWKKIDLFSPTNQEWCRDIQIKTKQNVKKKKCMQIFGYY